MNKSKLIIFVFGFLLFTCASFCSEIKYSLFPNPYFIMNRVHFEKEIIGKLPSDLRKIRYVCSIKNISDKIVKAMDIDVYLYDHWGKELAVYRVWQQSRRTRPGNMANFSIGSKNYAEGIERYNQLLNTGEMKFKIYKIYFTDGTSEIIDYDDKTSMR